MALQDPNQPAFTASVPIVAPPSASREIRLLSEHEAAGVPPTRASPMGPQESDASTDDDDARLTSPEASPKKTASQNDSPHFAVAVHFVSAPGRICAHCRAVKTPLWRNGPLGPKTLCNACGVRYKLGKLQVSANGQTLVPVVTKPSAGGRKRPFPGPPPRTPPKKLRQLNPGPASRSARLPILTNHDGALLLLQLAGIF
mmetsp:Transcript_14298/g.30628  ORF Transcript_14298/g.30628 Transcript_14298/m.30628 type:complete len:200 (-) Transcript_14298:594-1193(-)